MPDDLGDTVEVLERMLMQTQERFELLIPDRLFVAVT